MKNTYSILSLFIVLFSVSVFGQSKIYAPSLRAPSNSAIKQMPDALLDWDAVTGITLDITYEAQLATNVDFTDAITFARTDITSEKMNELLFGQTYFWRVRAFDSGEASDWSDVWSFMVIEEFSFTSSPTSGKVTFVTQKIDWPDVTGLTKYQLEVDTTFTWKLAHTVTGKNINGSHMFPDGRMWIAGDKGLLKYFDGNNWLSYDVPDVRISFNDVFFINETTGYAVGDDSVAFHFDGVDWSQIYTNVDTVKFDYNGVSFANENLGWIVCNDGIIIKYSNGTWSKENSSFTKHLNSIYVLSDTDAWTCGKKDGSNNLMHFDGTEWTETKAGSKDLNDIFFTDEYTGYVVGKGGVIYRYDTTEWVEMESNTNKDLFGVAFTGDYGIAVGASGTLLTYSGVEWEANNSVVGYQLSTALAHTPESVYAMGDNGVVVIPGDGEFSSPFVYIINISSDSSEYTFNSLLFGQSYYYRLRGMHSLDTSEWSIVKSIRTYSSPSLNFPENNIINTDLFLGFSWSEYKGITNYIFEVDSTADFAQPRSFLPEEDSMSVNDFIYGQDYFWRVAAQHIKDISDWSDTWTFSTVNTITLLTPENQETGVSACPLYTWVEIPGTSEYELWLDTDESFSNPQSQVVEEAFYQCQASMEKKTVYYWRVRGLSGAKYSEWSDTWQFKTEGYIGIDEQINDNSVSIYPNPGNGEFTLSVVSLTNSSYTIKVIDVTGRVIYISELDCKIGENNTSISLDNIRKGAYSLIINNGEQVVTKQLLIQ